MCKYTKNKRSVLYNVVVGLVISNVLVFKTYATHRAFEDIDGDIKGIHLISKGYHLKQIGAKCRQVGDITALVGGIIMLTPGPQQLPAAIVTTVGVSLSASDYILRKVGNNMIEEGKGKLSYYHPEELIKQEAKLVNNMVTYNRLESVKNKVKVKHISNFLDRKLLKRQSLIDGQIKDVKKLHYVIYLLKHK